MPIPYPKKTEQRSSAEGNINKIRKVVTAQLSGGHLSASAVVFFSSAPLDMEKREIGGKHLASFHTDDRSSMH